MPSFVDELKSKNNIDIQRAEMEKNILACKDKIIDRIIQCQVTESVKKIKEDLIATKPSASHPNYYEVRYSRPEIKTIDFLTLLHIFREMGFDLGFTFHTDEFRKRGLEEGLCSSIGADLDSASYGELGRKMGITITIGEYYYSMSAEPQHHIVNFAEYKYHNFSRSRYKLNDNGLKYVNLLTKYANLEGIDISYNMIFSGEDIDPYVKYSKKELEWRTCILASVYVG